MNDDKEYIGVFQIKLKKKFYSADKVADFSYTGNPKDTKTLIILTHLARRHFVPKTFFTKNSKDMITVYGILKPEYKHLQGGSIFSKAKELIKKGVSKVKEFFSPRLDNFNNVSTRVLKQYGNVQVVDINIYRTPIPSMLNTIINFVSGGRWKELLNKYGYDKLFHLALVFRLSNGKMIIVEKNEAVNINDFYRTKPDTEVFHISAYSGGKTLYDFINGARQKVNNDKIFFGYHPFDNNCQFFIKYILETTGLYSEDAKSFLFQDLSKVAEGLSPTTKTIMKGVTDLGAVVSKISGKGKKVGGADAELTEAEKKIGIIRLTLEMTSLQLRKLISDLEYAVDGINFSSSEMKSLSQEAEDFYKSLLQMNDAVRINQAKEDFFQSFIERCLEFVARSYRRQMEVFKDAAISSIRREYDSRGTRNSEAMLISSVNELFRQKYQEIIDYQFPDSTIETHIFDGVQTIKDNFREEMVKYVRNIKSIVDDFEDEPLPPPPNGGGKVKKGRKGKKVGGADSGSDDELSEIFTKLKVAPPMDVDTAPRPVAPAPPKEPIVRKRAKTPEDKDAKKEKRGSGKQKVGGMEKEQRFTNEEYQHTKRIIYAELKSKIERLEGTIRNITARALREVTAIEGRRDNSSGVLRKDAIQRFNDDIDRINSDRDRSIDRIRSEITDLRFQLRAGFNPAYIARRTLERLGKIKISRDYRGPFGGPGVGPRGGPPGDDSAGASYAHTSHMGPRYS